MKVVLTADVKDIGNRGDEKDVKPGFARNFLLPRGLAVTLESDEGKKELLAKELKKEELQSEVGKIAEIMSKNQGLALTFKGKASKEKKLFGSIKISQIESEIKDKIGIKPVRIEPNEPIKDIGEHDLLAKFPENQNLSFKVIVETDLSRRSEAKAEKGGKKA